MSRRHDGDERFHDCNETNWQVAIVLAGRYHYYSARSAAFVLEPETQCWERGKSDKAAKMRTDRQRTGFSRH